MAYSPASPVTGATVTGFTSPTYTLSADTSPGGTLGVQKVVSALGGTQTGVVAHSADSPFTINFERPKQFKLLGNPNANGYYDRVPKNQWKYIVRKGVTPAANQQPVVAQIRVEIDMPAGATSYDAANCKALYSAAIGVLWESANDIADSAISGTL